MKTSNKIGWALVCLFFASVVSIGFLKNFTLAQEAPETVYGGDIDQDLTLTKDQKVFFDGETNIINGKTLTIEEGVEITFRGNYASLNVNDGKIVATGTAGKKIIFKKEDDEHASYAIFFNSHEHQSFFRHVVIEKGGAGPFYMSRGFINESLIKTANAQFYDGESGDAAIEINGGKLKMENCEFKDSLFQDIDILPTSSYYDPNEEDEEDGIITVHLAEVDVINTNFSTDRALEAEQCAYYFDTFNMHHDSDRTFCREKVYLKNNYYGDADGPNIDVNGEEEDPEKGFYLKGDFKLDGWSSTKFLFEPETSGASNVLFLPGIKASHLYKYDSETDHDLDELWVPNWLGNDIDELKLDNYGKSIEKVFVKEGAVLQETVLGNLYKSFLADLDKLKTDNVINNYKAFAYDWRQSVEDIVKNGTPYENNEIRSVATEINNLAQNSKSGKVTIVAHSNGGLVAKAVMVEHPELSEKIDKIILVGTPQMGTPLAILSLIYGYEESLPTLLSQEEARRLVENMPGAYGLLPSDEYFKRTQESIINFSSENSERGKMFRDAYGEKIDSLDEFRDFLLAKEDNREKPDEDKVDLENILNEKLLDEAIGTHNNLDNWAPPASVKVIQLAGWGLPTVSGVNYVEKKKGSCVQAPGSSIPICKEDDNYSFIYEPKFTVDGDNIVTAPSSLMIPIADNVDKYWLDIRRGKFKKEHANIFEVANVRDFIKNEIQNNEASLPEYISNEKPADFESMKPRIKMSLYSPLDIHLYDSNGNHTGYKEIQTDEGLQRIIEENIPNSYYMQLGDRKYVGFLEGEDVKIMLDGYGEGAYTLKIEEVKETESGEEITNHITFKNLPTSVDTQVELIIPASGLEDIFDLKADYDGDGDDDYVLEPVLNQEVTMPDVIPPVIEITSPENKTYDKDDMLNIAYKVSDDKSTEDNIKSDLLMDNVKIIEKNIDLSFLKTGEHKIIVKAEDEANNKSEKEIIFYIDTNIRIIKSNINHFYDLRLIKNNQERKMLINNLSVIEKEIEFYNVIKNSIFLKNKTKKILLEIIERQIENHIDIIIHKIKQDKKNYVTMIKELMIGDLDYIKIKFNK